MANEDLEYSAGLDLTGLRKDLQKIGAELETLNKRGAKAFNGVEKAAKTSGVSLGVVSGVVGELTRQFIEMGRAAAGALLNVVKGGVDINKELETTERVFAAAFGSPDLGKEAVKFLDEVAEKLNLDKDLARQFGQSILPKTDSLENFEELLRLTDIQADSTGKSVEDLTRAVRDALSGDFASIRDQFDLGPEQIQAIKDLTPTLGAAGALAKVVGDEFTKLGKVNISGTLATDVKAVNSQFTDLQAALGRPVFDELKKQVADLGGVLDERGDDFAAMAGDVGDVVANIVDFIGSGLTDFLRDLDTEQVTEVANNFLSMVESGRTLVDVLGLMELPGDLIDGVETLTQKLDEALETAVKITALARAANDQRRAEEEAVQRILGQSPTRRASDLIGGFSTTSDEEGFTVANRDLTAAEQAEVAAAGEKAYKDSILETVEALSASEEREKAAHDAQRRRREEQEKTKAADQEALNAVLAKNQADKEAAEAAQALADAQTKVNEKMNDLKTDQARAELDLLIKAERAALDAALDAARKREDLARANLQKIADIETKNNQAISDATKDLARDEQDINRDLANEQVDATRAASQKRIDIARQSAQRRLDLETAFRRRLQDIQTQFAQSALDAERSRDAVAFLQAQRERAAAIADAQSERGRGIQDVGTDEGRQLEQARTEEQRAAEERKIQAQREREEAAIEHQRKLEDLQTRLAQELEAQRLNNEQAIEEARIAEERKQQDLVTARQRDEEDLKLSLERKRQDLERSLSEELALIAQSVAAHEAAEKQKTTFTRRESNERVAIRKRELREMAQNETARSAPGSTRQSAPGLFTGRDAGGPVVPGTSYNIGDLHELYKPYGGGPGQVLAGPGVFTPPAPGHIYPNRPSAVPAPVGASYSNINNSLNAQAEISLTDPTKLSPAQQQIVRNMMQTELRNFLASQRRAGVR